MKVVGVLHDHVGGSPLGGGGTLARRTQDRACSVGTCPYRDCMDRLDVRRETVHVSSFVLFFGRRGFARCLGLRPLTLGSRLISPSFIPTCD